MAGFVNVDTDEPIDTKNPYYTDASQFTGDRVVKYGPPVKNNTLVFGVLVIVAIMVLSRGKQ